MGPSKLMCRGHGINLLYTQITMEVKSLGLRASVLFDISGYGRLIKNSLENICRSIYQQSYVEEKCKIISHE